MTNVDSLKESKSIEKLIIAIAAKPDDNPSSPSIQLKELVTPTIQITVRKRLIKFGKITKLKLGKKSDKSIILICSPKLQTKQEIII